MEIIAGIVLYNPDVDRLKENIEAIAHQVDKLVFIENGSIRLDYIDEINCKNGVFIYNKENLGIAHALNQILNYAANNNYEWALTLDQDSVASPNLIQVFAKYVRKDIGIICPKVLDRNFSVEADNDIRPLVEVNECITSGSLTNVEAWKKYGGFDDQMFIDWVDWDFCYGLKKIGYRIVKTNETSILHELGENTRTMQIFGKERLVIHRPPFRTYYIHRNMVYLWRKHKCPSFRGLLYVELLTLYISLRFDTNKFSNLLAALKGVSHGLVMSIHVQNPILKC